MLTCPLGEAKCPISDELVKLQQQVDELTQQTRTDNLTGLFNQRHLLTTLQHEIERTKRSELATSLILLDIDHFKRVNDTYGHVDGDKALIHIANILRKTVRMLDIPCRYGGEEFAVVLPSTPILIAKQVAERVRQAIAETPVSLEHTHLPITASLGVDTYLFRHRDTPEEFIARTDTQLYAAKHAGRNNVCSAVHTASGKAQVSDDERNALFGDSGTQHNSENPN